MSIKFWTCEGQCSGIPDLPVSVISLTWVVLLVHSPLVVLLPAPAGFAVMTHLLQQVEHSDLSPAPLIVGLTVHNIVQRGGRSRTSLFTPPRVT